MEQFAPEGELRDVPAPRHDLLTPGSIPVMYSLWNSSPEKESWHRLAGRYITLNNE
jgi:hypothetical protein